MRRDQPVVRLLPNCNKPCWDLLLGERNSLSSKFEKHLHSWKPNLPNMENAWIY